MTRITPRTCLWPLAISLTLTFALSIGLTFRSDNYCYAGTCGEWLFPLQARLHVVAWYSWLSVSVTFLAVRAFHPSMRKILRRPLFERKLPSLGKQLTVSGIAMIVWILLLYGILTGIWWTRLHTYFQDRGSQGMVTRGNGRLAAIALTGHFADVTMGMVLIPISRHSALASFFKISIATTMTFHMIMAYSLFALVLVHGLLYVSWVPVFTGLSDQLRLVFPVLNPTYLANEVWPGNTSTLGIWRASLIFTGSTAGIIFILLFVTTLPAIRSRHFNLFYFTHLLSIPGVLIICLHASTMFYCTAPGIMMWILDWAMRLYELQASLSGSIMAVGKGWYSLSVPLPRRRLDGCACTSPLAHFYIYHSDSSIRELHPFTTTTHLLSQNTITHISEENIDIEFLFRKRGNTLSDIPQHETALGFAPSLFSIIRKLRRRKPRPQWTNKLASLADEQVTTSSVQPLRPKLHRLISGVPAQGSNVAPDRHSVPVFLRLEGPYFTPAVPARYNTVVCIVAGTGVSGAIAIAGAFQELERQSATLTILEPAVCPLVFTSTSETRQGRDGSIISIKKEPRVWTRCVVVWSVREEDFVDIPALEVTEFSALQVRVHLTGAGRPRLAIGEVLDTILKDNVWDAPQGAHKSTWVYVSGPNTFISAGEAACKERVHAGIEYYGARWDV